MTGGCYVGMVQLRFFCVPMEIMLLRLGFLSRKQHYKGLWSLASCHLEEMTGSGLTRLFHLRYISKEQQKKTLIISTSVTGNNCVLVKSLLALEMIHKVTVNHKTALFNSSRLQSGR